MPTKADWQLAVLLFVAAALAGIIVALVEEARPSQVIEIHPLGPMPYEVARLIEEARRITRDAAEGGD